jgi:glycosyltransferase involved in cell wall biosynthesis
VWQVAETAQERIAPVQPPVETAVETAVQASICVNGRFRVHKMTGLQRYAEELISRLGGNLQVVAPSRKLTGPAGHAWEQLFLPIRARGELLWSPCNTGPISVRRQVVTIHDMFPLDHPEWFSPGFAHCFRAVVPRLIRRAQHLIAVSEYTKRRIVAAVPQAEDKITVVHSGVGPQFSPRQEEAAAVAREIGIPGARYMLSVSSLEPRKNLKTVLRAWELALPQLPTDYWLVLAGGKGSATVFGSEDHGRVPERVLFAGYVPDWCLPGLYSGARAFIFPSRAEGFGFPPLEAMACGTPVLTSTSSSLPEVTGRAAYTTDPLDVHAVAGGIGELAWNDSLCSHLRDAGLSQARRFQWDVTARKTWDVLEREYHA